MAQAATPTPSPNRTPDSLPATAADSSPSASRAVRRSGWRTSRRTLLLAAALTPALLRAAEQEPPTWGVLEDTAQPGTHLEYFLVPSWLEHLRQHARVTGEERRLQEALRALHRGDGAPMVRHFVAGSAHDLAKPAPGHDDI